MGLKPACTWQEPWSAKSKILSIEECWLWDWQKEMCSRNENCPQPWLKRPEET